MKIKNKVDLLVPFLVVSVFVILNFTTFYKNAEWKAYDMMLHIKPPIEENKSLLFVDVDDIAISKVGVWPWSRNIMADGLILMREFNAKYAVFDIEYTEKSPLGVDYRFLRDEIPEIFTEEFSDIKDNIESLFSALRTGDIALKDAEGYIEDLTKLTEQSKERLLKYVEGIARDNDKYLGDAARFFGNAFFTINMLHTTDESVSKERRDFVTKNFYINNIKVLSPLKTAVVKDIRPAILPILKGAKGAGFPNVVVDEDGVRRRIELVKSYNGKYFAQLAFAPLLDWLGNPGVTVSSRSVILEKAKMPDGSVKNIKIPLDEGGMFLINWSKKGFINSFRHISYYELVLHKWLEDDLLHNLKAMNEAGYLSFYKGDSELLAPYIYAENLKKEVLDNGGDRSLIKDYIEARKMFFKEVGKFLYSDAEKELLNQLDVVISSPEVSDAQKDEYREVKAQVPKFFNETRGIYQNLMKTRAILKDNIPNSFCIIGHTGTSTTDIGVNPFEKEYMNVGTHASVVNTILNEKFLDDLPWWYSLIVSIVMAVVLTLIIINMRPIFSILVGLIFLLVLIGGAGALFLLTGVYINTLTPALSIFLTFIVLTFMKFLRTEKEKSFIRNAFTHYLSNDVVSELLNNPEKLNLGGEKKYLTALFTDVKGFSTISESLDPQDLVKLLNNYLSEMSNIILSLKGTIDKYEGDAIISFFGAPVEFEDHAKRACLSAIRMKKMEDYLNEHFIRENMSPSKLLTRIGINTGDMVVGNMGTEQKMDYTIMGNSVNLASRLEGVNKQYGTWVMISETTKNEAGDEFFVRKLDRVRVVGIHQPVRLFELLDEKANVDPQKLEAIEIFHEGLSLFEERDWDAAKSKFKEVLKILPEDGPSNVYIKRCNDFKRKAPPASWDGVFNLSMK